MTAQDIINLLEWDIKVLVSSKIDNLDQIESDKLFNEIYSRIKSFTTPSLLNIDTVKFMNFRFKDNTDDYDQSFFEQLIKYLCFCKMKDMYSIEYLSLLTEMIIKESLQFKINNEGYFPLFLYNNRNVINLITLLDISYIQDKKFIQEIYPFIPGLLDINKLNSIFYKNEYICHHGNYNLFNEFNLELIITYFSEDFKNFNSYFNNSDVLNHGFVENVQTNIDNLINFMTASSKMRSSGIFDYAVNLIQNYINNNSLTATQLWLISQNDDIFQVDLEHKLNLKNKTIHDTAYYIRPFLMEISPMFAKKIVLSSCDQFKIDIPYTYFSELSFTDTNESDLFYLTLISKGNERFGVSYEKLIPKLSETVRNTFNTYRDSSHMLDMILDLNQVAKRFITDVYGKESYLTDISFEDED